MILDLRKPDPSVHLAELPPSIKLREVVSVFHQGRHVFAEQLAALLIGLTPEVADQKLCSLNDKKYSVDQYIVREGDDYYATVRCRRRSLDKDLDYPYSGHDRICFTVNEDGVIVTAKVC